MQDRWPTLKNVGDRAVQIVEHHARCSTSIRNHEFDAGHDAFQTPRGSAANQHRTTATGAVPTKLTTANRPLRFETMTKNF